jgi:CRP-like cAMP-binding protein
VESAPRSPNGFLSSLTADDFELIRPHLRTADLHQEMVLVEVDETLKRAYLPHRGVISLVVKLARGEHVQIAMVGRDSIFGSFSALGDAVALNSAVVLVAGVASTIDIDQLRAAADQSATFRATLARHGLAVYAQIQQTAGCNASHTVESRLARCLLQTRDLSGSDKLELTQESMAQMIGAPQQRIAGGQHAAAGELHPLQPRAYRDYQSGRPDQDFLRMLRDREGPVHEAAAPAHPLRGCVMTAHRPCPDRSDRRPAILRARIAPDRDWRPFTPV